MLSTTPSFFQLKIRPGCQMIARSENAANANERRRSQDGLKVF